MLREDRCVVVPLDEECSSGGGSLTKKTPGLRSWILMEPSGQEMNLEVDKYTIMRRVQIHARDFRILDPLLSYPSKILCRQSAIVLNLEVFLYRHLFPFSFSLFLFYEYLYLEEKSRFSFSWIARKDCLFRLDACIVLLCSNDFNSGLHH